MGIELVSLVGHFDAVFFFFFFPPFSFSRFFVVREACKVCGIVHACSIGSGISDLEAREGGREI